MIEQRDRARLPRTARRGADAAALWNGLGWPFNTIVAHILTFLAQHFSAHETAWAFHGPVLNVSLDDSLIKKREEGWLHVSLVFLRRKRILEENPYRAYPQGQKKDSIHSILFSMDITGYILPSWMFRPEHITSSRFSSSVHPSAAI